jgi:poly(3-hydroxybutyrate) depolymerase
MMSFKVMNTTKKFIFILLVAICQSIAFSEEDQIIEGLSVSVFRPALSTDKPKSSLLIVLHGCSQKAAELAKEGNFKQISEDKNTVIALPSVPNGGVYMGCWDYYGMSHERSKGHVSQVIKLAEAMIADAHNRIDESKVYIAGLSSGGGMSMLAGCLAPDIFKGVGLNAAPVVGSTAMQISRAPFNTKEAMANCLKLAGTQADELKKQKAGIIYGDNDFIVGKNHNTLNASVLSEIYGANDKTALDLNKLPGTHKEGTGELYSDREGVKRLFIIENKGLGHNWPVGNGTGRGNFINKNSLDFTTILLSLFDDSFPELSL